MVAEALDDLGLTGLGSSFMPDLSGLRDRARSVLGRMLAGGRLVKMDRLV